MPEGSPQDPSRRESSDSLPHLLVVVDRRSVAISTRYVHEILIPPRMVAVPNAPAHVRGVVNVRGEVLPVVDLRRRLGMPSLAERTAELVALLRAREADHRNWIQELEACVRENRSFRLARDPHKCAFGKWYDTYEPDNVALQFVWSGFDRPHREIHALADVVTGHMDRGEHDQALRRIEWARRGALATMLGVFEEAVEAVQATQRELIVVLRRGTEAIAVTVDAADAVEDVAEEAMDDLHAVCGRDGGGLVAKTARRADQAELTLVLDVARLFEGGTALTKAA